MNKPDFLQIVTAALKPKYDREQENCRELADHLADLYEEALSLGQSPEVATEAVLSQLHQKRRLRRNIRRAQGGTMSGIFKRMWLPGVLMVLAVRAVAIPMEYLGFRPQMYVVWHHAFFVTYWYLMPGFFFAAALGAWYSRHQGGSVRERLVAGTFYALATICAITVPLFIEYAMEPQVSWQIKLESFVMIVFSHVVIPGIAMLLGTLPFLFSKDADGIGQKVASA